ncbi:UPF0182 family membrane protein [Aminipila terrae]|uniref:UPF0182 protein Ami3637_08070 n=1 Tax=Aminipila terrae TaxID=2697030 RepID=A0A6P1MGQ3_9FIRM|nr:UPF0182 family protein [Aminipila terrae]QHI72363.1 UPF0182 family protein [Aminipila terrae]
MKKNKSKRPAIILLVLVILLGLFVSLIGFFTDFLWFKELNYVSVFFTKLFTQLKIGVPTFVVISALAYLYLKVLKRGYFKKVQSSDVVSEKVLNRTALGLSAAFGLLLSTSVASNLWFEILQYMNSTSFGVKDPLFGNDVSFYVFKLQFISGLNSIGLGIIIAFAILTFVFYVILLSLRRPQFFESPEPEPEHVFDENDNVRQGNFGKNHFGGPFGDIFNKAMGSQGKTSRPFKKKQFDDHNLKQLLGIASKQIIILGVLFFLMVGVDFLLKQYTLLFTQSMGVVYGAGFTSVKVTLWVYRVLMVLAVVAAVVFATGIARKKYRVILTVPVIMIAIGLVGVGATVLVQNLIVSPDEINKESPYLKNNIKYTQAAYDLQNVTIKPFAASNTLSKGDILNNMESISNIRINDYDPAKKFYTQTQSIRSYYAFNDVDVDRYFVNGEYTQTFLAAREIDETQIREEWLNKHLKYTHGYGITLSRVDKVTASGQPDMLISGIPPVSQVNEINIKRPEIYFGELTNNYILTNTNEEEFDYPNGEDNKYAIYKGKAGIKLNLLNRVMFAIKEQSLKLLVSTNITNDSRIIINRNIEKRVQKIMPYLQYDDDPYIVAADGKLYWMIDAYTVSGNYPYSEPFTQAGYNYIRNSVKVVIDAYNGDTSFYLVDDKDPIATTYKKIYPELFKDFKEMPESIQAHIRYPNKLFNIQANVYKRYHMNDVKVFYQGEDLWDIANEIYGTQEAPIKPNYYIMKLPGETRAEFVNTIPYTPRNKKNMTGLLVARNDGDNYGKIVLYQLPKDNTIYGPMQVEAQIDQNTEISKEFSLWNSSGSTYSRGNLFIIPIEQSLLYVEPVYLEATNSSIPEVKRVIVVYGDKIAYKETLSEALDSLFGENSTVQAGQEGVNAGEQGTTTPEQMSTAQLITKANEEFDLAQDAQRNGDWAGYGEHITTLEKYLRLLAPSENQQQPAQ